MYIDTHKVFVKLTESGFNDEQANAILDTFSSNNEQLATKADLLATKADLQFEIKDLKREIMYKVVPILIGAMTIIQGILVYVPKP